METYNGHVRTPQDAILLFEACRIGLLPRVQRRLSEKERQQIKSGSVFVWDEREAGMRRWTDGKSWSASRVSGSFLTYREMEGKRGGSNLSQPAVTKRASGKSPDGSATGDSDGEGPDGYRYKPDGLMKQSFSITTSSGQHLHLISYYSRSNSTPLQQPSNDPQLRHIRPPKNMYPESTVTENQAVPAITRGPMANTPYASSPQVGGPQSPYTRPPPVPSPVYQVPMYAHPSPHGSPSYQYGYAMPPGPYFHSVPQVMFPAAYPPHALDRPPHPISNPNIPPAPPHSHHALLGAHPAYAGHQGAVPYLSGAPLRGLQPNEHVQHQPHTNSQYHAPAPTSSLPEQGPQLPAINATTPATNKPPTPQPTELRVQESLSVPETNGASANNAPSPARTIPTLGSILNNHPESGAEPKNQSNSRSGSRSPNSSQRPLQELPADKLASNSMAADTRAVEKLNKVFSVRT